MTIQEYIQQNQENLSFSEIYQGQETAGEWTYDLFSCNLNGFIFPYKMGIGLRKQKKEVPNLEWDDKQLIEKSPSKSITIKQAKTMLLNLVDRKNVNEQFVGASVNDFLIIEGRRYKKYFIYELVHPTLAQCLESLLADYQCVQGRTFEEFCTDLGYDLDSRRAEKIYHLVLTQTNQLSSKLPNWQDFIRCEEA